MKDKEVIEQLKKLRSFHNGSYAPALNVAIHSLRNKPFLTEAINKRDAKIKELERPKGKWIVTAEDNEGIHRIQCPFCRYEKGSDFIDYITVTFEKLPPFCEYCGADLKEQI